MNNYYKYSSSRLLIIYGFALTNEHFQSFCFIEIDTEWNFLMILDRNWSKKEMSENEIYPKKCRSDLNKGQTPIQQIDTVYNWAKLISSLYCIASNY